MAALVSKACKPREEEYNNEICPQMQGRKTWEIDYKKQKKR